MSVYLEADVRAIRAQAALRAARAGVADAVALHDRMTSGELDAGEVRLLLPRYERSVRRAREALERAEEWAP